MLKQSMKLASAIAMIISAQTASAAIYSYQLYKSGTFEVNTDTGIATISSGKTTLRGYRAELTRFDGNLRNMSYDLSDVSGQYYYRGGKRPYKYLTLTPQAPAPGEMHPMLYIEDGTVRYWTYWNDAQGNRVDGVGDFVMKLRSGSHSGGSHGGGGSGGGGSGGGGTDVPEPGTFTLFLLGLAGLAITRRVRPTGLPSARA